MQKAVYEYISKKTPLKTGQAKDPIIEWKICAVSGEPFAIFQSDLDFYEKISPSFGNHHDLTASQLEKQNPLTPFIKGGIIPTPTLCPDFRHMRRMLFRNDRSLYKRKCDGTGKDIICMYAPDKPYKVYDRDYWWSDDRSAFDYGIDFDFNKTFNEQFDTLLKNVPMSAVLNSNSENSNYVNQTGNMKNSYLMFSCMDSENCYYGSRIFDSKYCVDCSVVYNSENCYECIDAHNIYKCFFCQNVENCSDSYFLFDCKGCKNCFGCWNLNAKEYHIFNKPYSRDEYSAKLKEFKKRIGSYKELKKLKKEIETFMYDNAIFRNMYLDKCENTYGGFLYNSESTINCYDGGDLEKCKYGLMLHNAKYVLDGNNSTGAEWQYEVSTGGIDGYKVLFGLDVWPQNSYVLYSAYTPYCSNLFGCVGLRQQSYCFFNKQYSKQEYEQLVSKIIYHMMETGEWGEFFDPSISPFGYNESAAFEYFPIGKSQCLEWNLPRYDVKSNTGISDISQTDSIFDTDEKILDKLLYCTETGKAYKLISQELDFYKKYGLAIPRLHPDIRHKKRFNKKPSRELHLRTCNKCGTETLSVYPQDSEFKVYGESCYNKGIYG